MSDDDAFNKITRRLRRREEAQRQKARQEMAVICDRLTVPGVTRVAIAYDGYGDEGAVQSVFAFTGDEEVKLASDIVEALSDAACELLPAGWEISDGSFGELVLDVARRTLTREHHRRITETEYDEEDFQL